MKGTIEYTCWKGIKSRCLCKTNSAYPAYGGSGITVSDSWMKFENFFTDMGHKPTPKYTIERIDNSLGYSKENCKWATQKEQMNNMKRNKILTFNGTSKTMSEWSDHVDISYYVIRSRLRSGWSTNKALTTPVRKKSL